MDKTPGLWLVKLTEVQTIIQIYLVAAAIPTMCLLLLCLINGTIMNVSWTNYQLCAAGVTSEGIHNHLHMSSMVAFVIILGNITNTVYMQMLFIAIDKLYKYSGVIMTIVLFAGFVAHIINLSWLGKSKCVRILYQTSTGFYTLALVNTLVFFVIFLFLMFSVIMLSCKTMATSKTVPKVEEGESRKSLLENQKKDVDNVNDKPTDEDKPVEVPEEQEEINEKDLMGADDGIE